MFCESHFSFKAPLLWAASDGLSTESLVKGTHIGLMLAISDLAVSWEVWPPYLLPAALVGRTVDPWWQDLGRWWWWNKVSRSSFQSGHKTQKYLLAPTSGRVDIQEQLKICEWGLYPYVAAVHLLSHVWLLVTPWTAAQKALLSSTISWSLLTLMFIELVMLPLFHNITL